MSFDISSILTAANPASTTTAASKTDISQNYTTFLKLLTTQLKNQDPTAPMDPSTFTSQLVQFSSVEQQIKSNTYLQQLLTLGTVNLTNVGLGYVGLDVQMPGSSFQFDGTNTTPLSYSMPAGATNGKISILDASGNAVSSMDANLAAGTHNFSWNGKTADGTALPAGTYTLSVGAQDAQQKPLAVSTFVSGLVTGVQTGDNGSVSVIINGQPVDVTTVHEADLPGAVSSAIGNLGTNANANANATTGG